MQWKFILLEFFDIWLWIIFMFFTNDPYKHFSSIQIRENKDQKKVIVWTLFTQCSEPLTTAPDK